MKKSIKSDRELCLNEKRDEVLTENYIKQKGFKLEKFKRHKKNTEKIMNYKTYAEAVRNRRSDEITIYDPVMKVYRNVKIYPRFKRRRLFFTW